MDTGKPSFGFRTEEEARAHQRQLKQEISKMRGVFSQVIPGIGEKFMSPAAKPEADFLNQEVNPDFIAQIEQVLEMAIQGEDTPQGHFNLRVSDVFDMLQEYVDQQQADIEVRRNEIRDAAFDDAFGILPQEIKTPSARKSLAAQMIWGRPKVT